MKLGGAALLGLYFLNSCRFTGKIINLSFMCIKNNI